MAIRRTKREKEEAQLHRAEQLKYSFTAPTASKKTTTKTADPEGTDLYEFDMELIKKDLLRTGIAIVVVFGILVALYFRL